MTQSLFPLEKCDSCSFTRFNLVTDLTNNKCSSFSNPVRMVVSVLVKGICMSSPYGLQITENCLICKLRLSGFFCDLPKPSLEHLEKIKYASAFPQGAVLFVEGQAPRGIYIICTGRVKLSTTSRNGRPA